MSLVILSVLPDRLAPSERARVLPFDSWSTGAMIDELSRDIDRVISGAFDSSSTLSRKAARYNARAPLNADLRALRAELVLRKGDVARAKHHLDMALELNRTNVLALRRRVALANEESNPDLVLRLLDPLFRRNPVWITEFQNEIAALLQSEDGRAALVQHFTRSPLWLRRFFHETANNETNLPALSQLVLKQREAGQKEFDALAEFMMRVLVMKKRYVDAHRLFLFTRSREEANVGGYIFNGDFSKPPSNIPFDWQIKEGSTVSISPRNVGAAKRWIELEFHGARSHHFHVRQNLYLPPGRYRLEIEHSAKALEVSSGLNWTLSCVAPAGNLTRVSVPMGTYRRRHSSAEFDIEECAFHAIQLTNDRDNQSSDGFFRGSLLIHGLSLLRVVPITSG